MAINPDKPFPKSQGDPIRSKDWNDVVNEIIRLDNARVGADRLAGPLSVDTMLGIGLGATPPSTTLHVAGGNWDPNASEGDVKVGDATFRLKIGVATGGAGAGDVRLRAQGGTNRMMLGTAIADVLTLSGSNVGINTTTPGAALDVNGNLKLSGIVDSPMFKVTQLLTAERGPLSRPLGGTFTSGGGVIIVFASGTAWWTQGNAPGNSPIGMSVQIDGQERGRCATCSNEPDSHKALASNPIVVSNLPAGSHTLKLVDLPFTRTDQNDYFSVTVLELPLPQPAQFTGINLGNVISRSS